MAPISGQNIEIDSLPQWDKALLLLSLDRVRPFWEDMGFRAPDSDCVRDIVRRFVAETREWRDDEPLESHQQKHLSLINTMFASVRTICGSETEDALRHWVTQIYFAFVRKEPWYESWQILFLRLAEGNLSQLAGQGISDEKLTAFKQLVERWRDAADEINTRIDDADAQPLAGWDADQYNHYRRESPDISPLDYLSNFLNNYAFSQFWEGLLNLLSPEEMAILNRWGQLYTALRTTIPPAWAEIPPQYMRSPFAHT